MDGLHLFVIAKDSSFLPCLINFQDLGDLGLVAKVSRSSQSMMRKPNPLTVAKVFETFRLIAKVCLND